MYQLKVTYHHTAATFLRPERFEHLARAAVYARRCGYIFVDQMCELERTHKVTNRSYTVEIIAVDEVG